MIEGRARVFRFVAISLAIALSGCGGGGGGGGGSAGGTAAVPLVYSGATTAASVTPTNAAAIVGDILGSGAAAAASGFTGISIQPATPTRGAVAGATRRLTIAFRTKDLKVARKGRSGLTGLAVDETDPCDSGTIRIQGTLADPSATGTLTVTYNACRTGTDTLNGVATMTVDRADPLLGLFLDFTVVYTRITFTAPGVNSDLSGSLRVLTSTPTQTETITENFVTRDNITTRMTKTENLVSVNVYNNIWSPTSLAATMSGRVFDSVSGYVDVTTTTPLVFSTMTQSYADGGQLLISGGVNTRIRLSAISSTLAKIEVDSDGDGSFETAARLNWTDLSGAIGNNLRDSDGDGMHDSWEIAYGLNPNSAADAASDKDGDGATNLAEYLAGSDPASAASQPVVVNLGIAVADSADPVVLNAGGFFYSIIVTNSSPNPASNVIVTDNLPAGLNFLSVSSSQGSCTGTANLSCALGILSGFASATITVSVNPTGLGVFSNTASVVTGSYEANLADNSATADTTVGPATVNLAVSLADSPDPVPQGGALTYTVTVTNTSTNTAAGVGLTVNLPAGASFVSVSPTQGTCSGTTTISCNLGTLIPTSAMVTIHVLASAQGVLNTTAAVTTTSVEPFVGDNSATASTTVGAPSSVLQGMIDAAFAGDTITVPPGTYLGGVTFGGKDITLQSRDGPATTLISGGGTVVTMGPGGTLSGFTITGGTATFGAGLAVNGAGSVISGNIFDGNAQGAGGYGAAIGGNVASPSIEANVFRNNSCDGQFLSGVVAFINGSSPRIVNNVFENNLCRGINLSVSSTPFEVVNNTFVANTVGIYIGLTPQASQIYRNNILVGNGAGLYMTGFGGTLVWTNSLVFGNTTDFAGVPTQTGSNGNIAANPMLANPASGDYHLQAGSPAINAGSASNAPALDFDGLPRSSPDIGAFEKQ